MDSSFRQKINRETSEVSDTDRYRLFLKNHEYTPFSTAPGTLSKIHYNTGYRKQLK
jgi:hypothetical protein